MLKYLNLALSVAIKSRSNKKYHLGAVAIRRDDSVVVSWNLRTRLCEPSAHAEARVLRKAGYNAKALYVARCMADGSFGTAKPCYHCRNLIIRYGVKKVIYSISDSEYGTWIP